MEFKAVKFSRDSPKFVKPLSVKLLFLEKYKIAASH